VSAASWEVGSSERANELTACQLVRSSITCTTSGKSYETHSHDHTQFLWKSAFSPMKSTVFFLALLNLIALDGDFLAMTFTVVTATDLE
jgi:hypothetical protein